MLLRSLAKQSLYRFLASLIAYFLWISAPAYACMFPPMVETEEQYYEFFDKDSWFNWTDENVAVAVILTQTMGREYRDLKDISGETVDKEYVKLKVHSLDVIYGTYQPLETQWWPALSQNQLNIEIEAKNSASFFDFWDRADVVTQRAYGYSGWTSCGYPGVPTLAPDMFYLHFQKDGKTIGFEPITGESDPLIQDIKTVYSKDYSKARRTPKDFFSDFTGFMEIEMSSCPIVESYWDTVMNTRHLYYEDDKPIEDTQSYFTIIDKYGEIKTDIRQIDFMAYRHGLENINNSCTNGDRYLVIDKITFANPRLNTLFNDEYVQPRQRFLKISEDREVNMREVRTKIIIESQNPVSSEHIKNWIREGSKQNP